jgi:aldehyde:ferredoxin oxidoreductase
MTGLDVSEEELMDAGRRIYTLERYYNNLVGFDGSDDDLPGRFVEGHEDAIPAQGGSEGQLAELDQLKDEYYEVRGWVDGVVPDERLAELDIDIGPGTGVSRGDSQAPADD